MQTGLYGPTLLDLAEIYECKLNFISTAIPLRAMGSTIGSLASGLLLDKLKEQRYFIIFGCMFIFGFCTAIFPHLMYHWGFFAASTLRHVQMF